MVDDYIKRVCSMVYIDTYTIKKYYSLLIGHD